MTSYVAGGMVPNKTDGSGFYNHLQAKILAETYYTIGYDLYKSVLPLLSDGKTEDTWK